MLIDFLPSFKDELQKLAANKPMDWKDFEKKLKTPSFHSEALSATNDPKLKQYIKNYGGSLTSKDLRAFVQSSSNPDKEHKVKKLPNGRFSCSCKDWQYKHSVKNGECRHIKRYRQYLDGLVKSSAANLHMAVPFFRGVGAIQQIEQTKKKTKKQQAQHAAFRQNFEGR